MSRPPPDFAHYKIFGMLRHGSPPPDNWAPWILEVDLSEIALKDLTALTDLKYLKYLDCHKTPVSDLTPLMRLKSLERLHCYETQISDLTPLAALSNLEELDCSSTKVTNLTPLVYLNNLRRLCVSKTEVRDLCPLTKLSGLQELNLNNTAVCDLTPLSGLRQLTSLHVGGTEVSDLGPLSVLTELRDLGLGGTKIKDFTPLGRMIKLVFLDVSQTPIFNLAEIANLHALKIFDCSFSKVTNLSPLFEKNIGLSIVAQGLSLISMPDRLDAYKKLNSLHLSGSACPGIDSALFGAEKALYYLGSAGGLDIRGGDCLPALIAHFTDLQAGAQGLPLAKGLILGNGQVGKTQVRGALFGREFDGSIPSTHGIQIETNETPGGQRLTIWDFGGQDLYHGTHGLFLKSGAVFVVCWTPHLETGVEMDPSGLEFPNRPLAYWLNWIKATAGTDVAVICVQTWADEEGIEAELSEAADVLLRQFAFRRSIAVSTLNELNIDVLHAAMRNALAWQDKQTGGARTGIGRVTAMVELSRSQQQTLTRAEFDALCAQTGGISDPGQFLDYLHRIGIVFHQPGLFGGAIVLDQQWALEAIYELFLRGDVANWLKRSGGVFTPDDLAVRVWSARPEEDRTLFLSMMESCGIAFALESRWGGRNEHTRWIAPAMLPPRATVERDIARDWDFDAPIETRTLDYGFLHDGLIRSLMAEVGAQAGYGGVYWDQGFVVYETETRSRLLVEATKAGGWTGQITLQARGPQAVELLSRIDGLLQRAENRAGLKRHADSGLPARITPERPVPAQGRDNLPDAGDYGQPAFETATKFGFPEQTQPLFALSYARKSVFHPGIETAVDAIESAARSRNAIILRDKNEIRVGNRISVFARRLAQAPHAIVVLSHKYLTVRDHCMQELFLIYRQVQSDPVELAASVHFWVLPCAPIHDDAYRESIIKHWEAKARGKFGPRASDKAGTTPATNRTAIANEIGPILAAIDDSARETDFDAFLERCFGSVDGRPRP